VSLALTIFYKRRWCQEDAEIDKHLLIIFQLYHCKLEDVPRFHGFNDFVRTFPLRKGKTKSKKDSEIEVGQFKVTCFFLYHSILDLYHVILYSTSLELDLPIRFNFRVLFVFWTTLIPVTTPWRQ